MRIIIMRHGDAVFQGAERILSTRGEQEARLTGLKLVSAFNITKIFCSSKRRAQQTAQIVHDLMRGRNAPDIEVLNELNPYGDASLVRDYIEATCSEDDTVLLISHIPQVVNLSSIFCERELELPTFFTAGALVLEPQKVEGRDYDRYCPCLFLAPNCEQRLDAPEPHEALDTPALISAQTAAAAAAVASALVVPAAVKLTETASIPLAVAVAAATSIPAAMRKAQESAAHSSNASVVTSSNLHSQRMLSRLAASHA